MTILQSKHHFFLLSVQEPVKRVLGQHHGNRQKGDKRRKFMLDDEVIDIPFLRSLEQWLNNPSILRQVNILLLQYICNIPTHCTIGLMKTCD